MSSENAGVAGPAPEEFAGPTRLRALKRLFHATRPKFYPASVMPVLVGSAWGYLHAGQFDGIAFLLALLATVAVHAGANVLNDVGDETGGTDRQNEDRIYPYTGGSRFIQAGILGIGGMTRLGVGLLVLAAIAGLALMLREGPTVLWFGLAGVLLAVLYSLGPVRLASIGLGEFAVGIAFGVLPVAGAAWLQTGTIDAAVIVFSIPVSAWVAAILLINEVPDIAADGATGKRTLPVRCGLAGTALIYLGLHLAAFAATGWLAVRGALPLAAPLVPALLLVLAFRAARAIRGGIRDRTAMTAAIETTLGIHTIGSIWLVGVALFAAFTRAA
ncbi:MAG: 1,4-dihydroxy-2-naphthoate octaprenyltransferase [Woeseiaceae bacterium]|nr:1,4-dihydroxy-2-naphthoate octaprenyltransferase [Woeseiaceae bacterium]